MRGANVVRRRSVTNPGDTSGVTGAVSGAQADGGGSGLLAGGTGDGAAGRRDASQRDASLRDGSATGAQAAPGTPAGGLPGPGAAPAASGLEAAAPAGLVRTAQPTRPGSSRSRFALVNWRVRWRLAAVIAVPTLTAAVLGALTINTDVDNWQATGRVQHLAQLNADVNQLSQALEDELNSSAAFAATRGDNAALAGPLKQAQSNTDGAASKVVSDSAGVTTGAGYQPGTVQDLNAVRAAINDLAFVRKGVTNS